MRVVDRVPGDAAVDEALVPPTQQRLAVLRRISVVRLWTMK